MAALSSHPSDDAPFIHFSGQGIGFNGHSKFTAEEEAELESLYGSPPAEAEPETRPCAVCPERIVIRCDHSYMERLETAHPGVRLAPQNLGPRLYRGRGF